MNGKACAYPTGSDGDPGLTKRELFAAMALQGILGSLSHPDVIHAISHAAKDKGMETDVFTANAAVSLADHLLAELEKSQ